jgi:hypothetical protein
VHRRRGVPNKATEEVRQPARQIIDDPAYLRSLRQRILEGKTAGLEAQLWHYAYERPSEAAESRTTEFDLKELLEWIWQTGNSRTAKDGVTDDRNGY